ncbi:MAG: bifunctional glutamate N-acetyltransferase/amino-acid acetyltransferase ArgJ [Bifidobacterium aquikefiri]|uniref:Arginine biosynthesis bifunctional protein ArgJ n=1 Tax=Bifidobacterium aquikefiri TaxID=1653207 RepID=A0A261G1Y6_9BIFI|nr:bifunctional glutamate N-acetyltransferase/amino-acid acetyltransferase ArgJ [Bifidobacterium aquikefiri]OZG65430.1 N-acetylglutamate synthase [Bifidobacterium aquikefiri]
MSVTFAQGFQAAGVVAGISSHHGKRDLAVVVNQGPLDVVAGVFTPNRFCAAPVQWSRKAVQDGHLRGVVVNSGGANACTGQAGLEQSTQTAQELARLLEADAHSVAVASTGLIGELLPLDHVLRGVDDAFEHLDDGEQAGSDAAHAIMTTDTKVKTVEIQGSGFRVGGMVKGSGMIAPQLATMICILTTDAVVTPAQAQQALHQGTQTSFNRIDVDGCMSTNDTVILLASGASEVTPDIEEFNQAVAEACASLAHQIVGDGEGSSHDVDMTVIGASDERAALACARAVASSNLMKCAIAGNDPNWGRVISSIGTVPESIAPYDPNKVSVDINGIRVCDGGKPGQDRSLVDMTPRHVDIVINLHAGESQGTIWTDDLTHEYVRINSDYES